MSAAKYLFVIFVTALSTAAMAVLPNPANGWVDASAITASASGELGATWDPMVNVINGEGLNADLTHTAAGTGNWTCSIDYGRWLWNVPNAPQPNLSPSGLQGDGWIAFTFTSPQALSQMWVWNYNVANDNIDRGWKTVAIDYSVDGINWQRLGGDDNWYTFNQASGTNNYACNNIIDLGGLTVKKIVLTSQFNGGIYGDMQYSGLSEVKFKTPAASFPFPSNKSQAATTAQLRWTAGASATTHDVYFGIDQAVVASATRANPQSVLVSQNQTGNFYAPFMTAGVNYYWRVDEISSDGETIWTGPVWSFKAFAANIPGSSEGWVDASAISVLPSGQLTGAYAYNTINGSGLQANLTLNADITDTQNWLCHINDGRYLPGWPTTYVYNSSPSGVYRTDGWIQYEFATPQSISNLYIWNLNNTNYLNRGWESVAIDYSADGISWSRFGGGDTYITFNKATGLNGYACNNIINLGGITVKKIVLNLGWATGNWGDPSYAGLSEVRFQKISATSPSPVIDGLAETNAILSWTGNPQAAAHDVYFGTDEADVTAATRQDPRGVLVSQGQSAFSFDPALEPGTTYYWRVDEVSSDGLTIWPGAVWSFKTLSPDRDGWINGNNIIVKVSSNHATMPGERTIDSSGLSANLLHDNMSIHLWTSYYNTGGSTPSPSGSTGQAWISYEFGKVYSLREIWVWNYNVPLDEYDPEYSQTGRGFKDVYVDYSADGINWTRLMNGTSNYFTFTQAPGSEEYACNIKLNLAGASVKHVVLTAINNFQTYDNHYGLSEVRFSIANPYASAPSPAAEADNIPVTGTVLSWTAGEGADSHDIYLGTDSQAVQNATPLYGDVNGSGNIDLADMAVFALQWSASVPSNSQYWCDLNDDGQISLGDLAKIAQSWLVTGDGVYRCHYPLAHNSYIPLSLDPGVTYYWRVDERDGSNLHQGTVWSFTTSIE